MDYFKLMGFNPPAHENPADFFLDTISGKPPLFPLGVRGGQVSFSIIQPDLFYMKIPSDSPITHRPRFP